MVKTKPRGVRLPQIEFSKLLLEAVDEGLSSLGDSPKQAILFYLENSYKIDKDNIPRNLTEFAGALEKIFGQGASYLEQLIIKRLYEKIGIEFQSAEDWDFIECIDNAKKRLPLDRGE
jgi:hypothetical protein